MKRMIIFWIGCFFIGFGSAAFDFNMLVSWKNFVIVLGFDLIWAITVFHKEFYQLTKLKK